MKCCVVFFLSWISILAHGLHPLYAYDDEVVHRQINQNAALRSELDRFLREQLRFDAGITDTKIAGKTVQNWIEEGGTREDDAMRWLNHFHDPLRQWDDAGLDMPLLPTGISSLVWAQASDDPGALSYNASSWVALRTHYYRALTTGSEADWAKTFQALGQVMHLVADAAVPAHVRNDTHPSGDSYEKWAKEQAATGRLPYEGGNPLNPRIFRGAVHDPLAPFPISALWDQNVYDGSNPSEKDTGLAEYTNAFFFSSDTIWPSPVTGRGYPHPTVSLDTDFWSIDWENPEEIDREDGKADRKIYLRHTGSSQPFRLLASSYWLMDCLPPRTCWGYAWLLDHEVFRDYASLLVPRAVNHCAALVDYFFRGRLDAAAVSLRRDANGNFSGAAIRVRNGSRLGGEQETMAGGRLDLAVSFVPPGGNDPARFLVDGIREVAAENDPINSGFVSVDVLFPQPIPATTREITLTLVYRGRLGGEDGAVVGKVLPLTSRIAYTCQPGCGSNPSFLHTVRPDGTDDRRLTEGDEGFDYMWRANPAWSGDGRFLAFNGITADNRYEIVVVDLASDVPYPGNIKRVFRDTACHFIAPSFSPDGTKIVAQRLRNRRPPDESDLVNALVILDVETGGWSFPGGIDSWRDKPHAEQPSWSPVGDRIVFQHLGGFDGSGAVFNLWSMRPDGSGMTRLTDDTVDSRRPAWSPDGKKILFASRGGWSPYYNLWVMDGEGGNAEALADFGTDCVHFSLSPGGERLVFQVAGGWIYAMNLDGTDLRELATEGCAGTPEWSPLILDRASIP
ncbi:MAG: hypothetical protein GX443_01550 [Deltaproteobacteria bacterium]|nr:hypothetical protein [Deltaproteobacteria bacterium]